MWDVYQDKSTRKETTVKKKVPVVTVAEPAQAAGLTGLSVEATVALADVAGAIKEDPLGFSDVGLVVMRHVMEGS